MKKYEQGKLKWFLKVIWAWQDEKEEQWLEQQSLRGWHLVQVVPFFYRFCKGSPVRVVYRLDYKMTLDKDHGDYLEIFKDSGWELVTTMSNWHYYRTEPKNDRVPEIYSTNRTRVQKYRRLLMALLPSLIILGVVLNPASRLSLKPESGVLGTIYFIANILMLLIMVFLAYGTIRILIKIRQLESGPRE